MILEATSAAPVAIAPRRFAARTYTMSVPDAPDGEVTLTVTVDGREIAAATRVAHDGAAETRDALAASPAIDAFPRTLPGRLSIYQPNFFIYGAGREPAAKFQLSLKYRVLTFGRGTPERPRPTLQLAYTQRSLWDLEQESEPFYDTSYMPELFVEYLKPPSARGSGFSFLGWSFGYRHESNGKDGNDSRGIDVVYARSIFACGSPDAWYVAVAPEIWQYITPDDHMPYVEDYRGYGKMYLVAGHGSGPSLSWTFTPAHGFDHLTHEIGLSLPVGLRRPDFAAFIFVQYFDGYAESILNYNARVAEPPRRSLDRSMSRRPRCASGAGNLSQAPSATVAVTRRGAVRPSPGPIEVVARSSAHLLDAVGRGDASTACRAPRTMAHAMQSWSRRVNGPRSTSLTERPAPMEHDSLEGTARRRSSVVRIAEERVMRRRAAVMAVLLACAAVACGTPTASRGAAPLAAPPAGSADASRPDGASRRAREDGSRPDAADGSRSDPQPVYAPRVVVTPSGDAYLVLRSGPEQLDGGVAWHVLYLAREDPAELARPEAEDRLASAARDLAEAFRPLAELVQAGHLSVTALIGKPGGSGAIEQRAFARDAGPWRAAGAARRHAIEQVPAIAVDVVREPDEEASARDAAAEFLSDAVRADYDAAWARVSAIMKAVMSRTEFDRNLAALPLADGPGDGELYLSFPASAQRFLPGTFVEVWLAREAAERVGVQVLELRLDDDMEWRVAVVVNLTAAAASPGTPTALQDASRRTPHSPPEAARHSSP